MEFTRQATQDDITTIGELWRAGIAELLPTRGGAVFAARETHAEPVEAEFVAALMDDKQTVWVAGIDDVILGFAVGRAETLRNQQVLGHIDDIYVDPEARAIGLGEMMMENLLEWFRSQQCFGIDATALPGNRSTKNFFEDTGFTARLLIMHHHFKDE